MWLAGQTWCIHSYQRKANDIIVGASWNSLENILGFNLEVLELAVSCVHAAIHLMQRKIIAFYSCESLKERHFWIPRFGLVSGTMANSHVLYLSFTTKGCQEWFYRITMRQKIGRWEQSSSWYFSLQPFGMSGCVATFLRLLVISAVFLALRYNNGTAIGDCEYPIIALSFCDSFQAMP